MFQLTCPNVKNIVGFSIERFDLRIYSNFGESIAIETFPHKWDRSEQCSWHSTLTSSRRMHWISQEKYQASASWILVKIAGLFLITDAQFHVIGLRSLHLEMIILAVYWETSIIWLHLYCKLYQFCTCESRRGANSLPRSQKLLVIPRDSSIASHNCGTTLMWFRVIPVIW